MFELFQAKLRNYVESIHVVPVDQYRQRVETCDACEHRSMNHCRRCRTCQKKPLDRMCEMIDAECPMEKW